ncbi:MAG: hypothetical protein ACOYN3_06435 [Acidimicrobiia bacterium]
MAQLELRHTRTHMPTRRVALAYAQLPTSGAAEGLVLLEAIMVHFVPQLDEETRGAFAGLLTRARAGQLPIPGIALRFRMQTDTHGLDYSRHRIVYEPLPGFEMLALADRPQHPVIELDTHGSPTPQVLGAVMAAARLAPTARGLAFRSIQRVLRAETLTRPGYVLRLLPNGVPGAQFASYRSDSAAHASYAPLWDGIDTDARWAMEVLGLRPDIGFDRTDVQRRFRRLLRLAHPDQGAEDLGAAERITELAEAREILLAAAPKDAAEV